MNKLNMNKQLTEEFEIEFTINIRDYPLSTTVIGPKTILLRFFSCRKDYEIQFYDFFVGKYFAKILQFSGIIRYLLCSNA